MCENDDNLLWILGGSAFAALVMGGIVLLALSKPATQPQLLSVLELRAHLHVQSGPMQGQRIPITHALFYIGRGTQNHLTMQQKSVSRRHAQISYDGNLFTIQDTGSKTGTFVNGQAIHYAVLNSGDVIRVGDTSLQFVVPIST